MDGNWGSLARLRMTSPTARRPISPVPRASKYKASARQVWASVPYPVVTGSGLEPQAARSPRMGIRVSNRNNGMGQS